MDSNLIDLLEAIRHLDKVHTATMIDDRHRALAALRRIEARLTEREPSPGPMNAAEMMDDPRR